MEMVQVLSFGRVSCHSLNVLAVVVVWGGSNVAVSGTWPSGVLLSGRSRLSLVPCLCARSISFTASTFYDSLCIVLMDPRHHMPGRRLCTCGLVLGLFVFLLVTQRWLSLLFVYPTWQWWYVA